MFLPELVRPNEALSSEQLIGLTGSIHWREYFGNQLEGHRDTSDLALLIASLSVVGPNPLATQDIPQVLEASGHDGSLFQDVKQRFLLSRDAVARLSRAKNLRAFISLVKTFHDEGIELYTLGDDQVTRTAIDLSVLLEDVELLQETLRLYPELWAKGKDYEDPTLQILNLPTVYYIELNGQIDRSDNISLLRFVVDLLRAEAQQILSERENPGHSGADFFIQDDEKRQAV